MSTPATNRWAFSGLGVDEGGGWPGLAPLATTAPIRQILPAEERHATGLAFLAAHDDGPRPPGWALTPRAVVTFICGSDGKALEGPGQRLVIAPKFVGERALVERCVVPLGGERGLLLVGEPGTAKSVLSELLSAAVCGTSALTVQGTADTTEDAFRYGWKYALLLAQGPSRQALVDSPVLSAMRTGRVARVEEITRCLPEVQDALVSILSDRRVSVVAELRRLRTAVTVVGFGKFGAESAAGAHQDLPEHVLAVPGPAAAPVVIGSGVLDDLLVTGGQQNLADVAVRTELGRHRTAHHVVLDPVPVPPQRFGRITTQFGCAQWCAGASDEIGMAGARELLRLEVVFRRGPPQPVEVEAVIGEVREASVRDHVGTVEVDRHEDLLTGVAETLTVSEALLPPATRFSRPARPSSHPANR